MYIYNIDRGRCHGGWHQADTARANETWPGYIHVCVCVCVCVCVLYYIYVSIYIHTHTKVIYNVM